MNLQSVSLSQLVPLKTNPRKAFEANALEGLAASIRTDGLLQNLVVRPVRGKGYGIVSGERRYRALKLLEERGELPEGFAVPVEVREGLNKDESLRISTVENLQRANLTPLEETAALTKLIHDGVTLDDLAAQTGLSPTTIKRRLALNTLCKQAAKALRDRAITLSQAEALTLGGGEAQERMIEEIMRGHGDYSAEDIKASFLDDRPTVALAIFPVERYTGTITTDLFAEGETSYFDDAEQFFELQKEAVEGLAAQYRDNAAWVEVTEHYRIPEWQYREAEEGERGGVIINLAPSGKVEIRDGLMKRDLDEKTASETSHNPLAPRKAKASYGAPLRRSIAHHKSMAVQEVLLASPRKAKEVAAVKALMELQPHGCVKAFAEGTEPPTSYLVLAQQTRLFAELLGIALDDDATLWQQFRAEWDDEVVLYEAVKALSDHELGELHTLLAALSFGQRNCERLDTGDSLFTRVARDLGVDMKNHWRPDRAFLERRNRAQLVEIAKASGYAEGRSCIGSYKKSELVDGLLNHFTGASGASKPNAAQRKALAWLPEVMSFPTVDPDAFDNVEGADRRVDS